MKIETLPGDPGRRKKRMRVGRGESSGKGKTSGRGNKGAQARTGAKSEAYDEGGQMPLHRRLPKRGFRPLSHVTYSVVNVGDLERFEPHTAVDPAALRAARLVRRQTVRVKILAGGALSKPLTVRAHAFSAEARAKIAQAGGACELAQ